MLWNISKSKKTLLALPIIVAFSFIVFAASVVYSYTSSVPVSLDVPSASLEVSGNAVPGALITIYDGAVPTATTTADGSGNFTKLIPTISSGLHSIYVSQKDVLGLESATTGRLINIPPQQLTQIEFVLPATIKLNKTNLVVGEQVTVSGYAYPGTLIEVYLDNAVVPFGTTTSRVDGFYSFDINTNNFSSGNHTIKTRFTTTLGVSDFSKGMSFNVEQQQPSAPSDNDQSTINVGEQKQQPPSPIITTPPTNTEVSGDKITIQGTAEPNSQILILVNGKEEGSVLADANGNWYFDFYPIQSRSEVTTIACIDNVCGDASEPIIIFYQVKGALDCRSDISFEKYRFNIVVGQELLLNAKYSQDTTKTIIIDWGDGTTEKFSVEQNTDQGVYKHVYNQTGQYNGNVTTVYRDSSCVTQKFFSVDVKQKKEFSAVDYAVIIMFISLIAALLASLVYNVRQRINNTTEYFR